MSPYHRTPLPTLDGLPSRGLFVPLQDPSSANHLLASVSRDERPVRLRGSVSVPTVPAPASTTAAPFSRARCRKASIREVAHSGVPLVAAIPRGLEPMRTANAASMGRHVHRGRAASSLTPGGHCTLCRARVESMSPSRSTGLSAAAILVPKALVERAPRLIAARLGPVRARWLAEGRMSRCGIPSSVRSELAGVAACQDRPGWVSVREEGVRFEEVCPELKLRRVPCVLAAVAGVEAVCVSVSRLPAVGAHRGVHSRSSWGF